MKSKEKATYIEVPKTSVQQDGSIKEVLDSLNGRFVELANYPNLIWHFEVESQALKGVQFLQKKSTIPFRWGERDTKLAIVSFDMSEG